MSFMMLQSSIYMSFMGYLVCKYTEYKSYTAHCSENKVDHIYLLRETTVGQQQIWTETF
jgi:hypothetical protein